LELTKEQVANIEKINARNLLALALRKLKAGKTLTRREMSIVRSAREEPPKEQTAGEKFMEQAKEQTARFGRS
jgi:hypothetical protein